MSHASVSLFKHRSTGDGVLPPLDTLHGFTERRSRCRRAAQTAVLTRRCRLFASGMPNGAMTSLPRGSAIYRTRWPPNLRGEGGETDATSRALTFRVTVSVVLLSPCDQYVG